MTRDPAADDSIPSEQNSHQRHARGEHHHSQHRHHSRQHSGGQNSPTSTQASNSEPSRSRRASEDSRRHDGGGDTSEAESGSDDDGGLQMQSHANGAANRRPPLSRAQSSFSQGRKPGDAKDGKVRMRHGWEAQLQSQEHATFLSQHFFMYFEDKRHETAGNLPPDFRLDQIVGDWRMKDRLKTVSALLAVCLNVGVDPPDVLKTNPCAKLECWIDPVPPDSSNQSTSNSTNAAIGKNLQSQYENLSLRTRYKVVLDPTIEELKRYTTSLRRNAHAERILFHYNGHGVPKPTHSGEVWCFNRSYTQYIPIGLYDLQDWVGAPGLWVWDCSAAGSVISSFLESAEKHAREQEEAQSKHDPRDSNRASAQQQQQQQQQQPKIRWMDCIHLAACRPNETLPTNPDVPADLFTSCLTTPIAMAVRFFILQNPLPSTPGVTLEQARNIPGKVSERRTPLGELNWIFTAITDTIAWNCLDKASFKKLFRQDLMVAALFRNFLLAQRVMRMYLCRPLSYPQIPDTHNHPLWQSWDLAVEMILSQLPKLIEQQKANESLEQQSNGTPAAPPELEYVHSNFFADQLSAFEVYLQSAPANATAQGYAKPPEQLPIVLQVLLSQVHRLRALILLSKFLDLGPWAVNLALSIGIFPYVLKLLQSQALELKPPMIFIWARILAVDNSCQTDLLKDQGYTYFTSILNSAVGIPTANVAEHQAMCAFVIAMLCKDFEPGKAAVLESNPEIIEKCLEHILDMQNPLLRQFSCLCLSQLWKDFPPAKAAALAHQAHARVRDRSHDPVPEVRAACLDALTSFVSTGEINPAITLEEETLASVVIAMGMDGSILVRKELTVFYSAFIKRYESRFVVAAWEQLLEERDKRAGMADVDDEAIPQLDGFNDVSNFDGGPSQLNRIRPSHNRQVSFARSDTAGSDLSSASSSLRPSRTLSKKTIYRAIWRQILTLSADPHPEVGRNAQVVMDYIVNALLDSELGDDANEVLDEIVKRNSLKRVDTANSQLPLDHLTRTKSREQQRPETPPSPAPSAAKPDGYFSLSRTASVKHLVQKWTGWGPKTPLETPPSPTSSTHRRSFSRDMGGGAYKSRPLTPADAANLPPDALDNIAGPPHQPPAKQPSTPHYIPRDIAVLPQIPLPSTFFTWSSSYFREPQMRPNEADEPGSLDYNERLWRRNRNDKIIDFTQPLKEAAGSQRWDVPCGYFGIGAAPVKMVFHQFDNHLVTSDDRDSLAIWDWKDMKQLHRFSNMNPKGSRVTELRFINEDDQAMLMTGSSDGVIRVFKNYDSPKHLELASSFRALSDLVASDGQNAGLVFDWQQGQGRILVAGDERVIRVWQVGHELCIADINSRSGSCITSLTSDQVEGNVFIAGFGNGSVRAYDQRLPSRDSLVMDWVNKQTDHRSWVVGVHLQRGGTRELISAESNGGVRIWDLRSRKAVAGIDGRPRDPRALRALAVHEHAPVFALGGADHTIRVYSSSSSDAISGAADAMTGKSPAAPGKPRLLSTAEPYMSYLRLANSSRHAPITAAAFHPHRMMLATGAVNDGHVNLFKCEAADDAGRGVGSANGALAGGAGVNGAAAGGMGRGVVEEWQG